MQNNNYIDYNFIRIIPIKKKFTENKKKNYVNVIIDYFIDQLLELNQKISIYEVIQRQDTIKFFLDIEKIPKEAPYLIFEIVEKFSQYMSEKHNIQFNDYIITINLNSNTHEGFSYHVIYDGIYSNIIDIGKFVIEFSSLNKFGDFIDTSIYTSNRLFKLPLQYGIDLNGKHKRGKKINNYHQIYFYKKLNHITIIDLINKNIIQQIFPNCDITILNFKQIHNKELILKTIIQNVPTNSSQCKCDLPDKKITKKSWNSGPNTEIDN